MNHIPKIISIFPISPPSSNFSDVLSLSTEPENLFTLLYTLNINSKNKTYKAIHNESREIYAIKIIPIIENNIKYLHNEIVLLKVLNKSEFIIKYYGSYISYKTNSIWLIFEYCCSGSAFDLMISMRRSFKEKEISEILKNILHALIFLHQINIFHKNIKASKILIKSNGIVKLNDFSKSIQILKNNRNLLNKEIKNDIFLLGITCIELFKGPFSEIERNNLIEKLKTNLFAVEDIFIINKNKISKEFIDFIKKCIYNKGNNYIDAYKLLMHDFIVKNDTDKNYFKKLVEKHYEGIENRKKKLGTSDIYEKDNIYINLNNNEINSNNNKINNNIIDNNKFLLNENNSLSFISNSKNDTHNNEDISIDMLAKFRFEQMKKGQINDSDHNIDKGSFLEENKSKNEDENCHFENKNNIMNGKLFNNFPKNDLNNEKNEDYIHKKLNSISEKKEEKSENFDEIFKENIEHLAKYNHILNNSNNLSVISNNKFEDSKSNNIKNQINNSNNDNNTISYINNSTELFNISNEKKKVKNLKDNNLIKIDKLFKNSRKYSIDNNTIFEILSQKKSVIPPLYYEAIHNKNDKINDKINKTNKITKITKINKKTITQNHSTNNISSSIYTNDFLKCSKSNLSYIYKKNKRKFSYIKPLIKTDENINKIRINISPETKLKFIKCKNPLLQTESTNDNSKAENESNNYFKLNKNYSQFFNPTFPNTTIVYKKHIKNKNKNIFNIIHSRNFNNKIHSSRGKNIIQKSCTDRNIKNLISVFVCSTGTQTVVPENKKNRVITLQFNNLKEKNKKIKKLSIDTKSNKIKNYKENNVSNNYSVISSKKSAKITANKSSSNVKKNNKYFN